LYLKALEIQGFKSFPEKTRLTFEKNITAIVGPNGSGKSNISDAILWVMGEQRTRALRGTRMEDVIFGGTEKRGKLGYAQVSLIFDNSERLFDSDNNEVVLTRRYYRSGESEYYINRETVRLKDIHSLLMDTGLGRDGYSIIGQGRIAEIISTKSTDRREVFEEAAGISRYRYRKEESERKLERTEENLVRINDKIEELELQVGPLKEQSEAAKKYLLLRDELRIKEISAWMSTLDRLRAQSSRVEAEYTETQGRLEKTKAELEALYASSGSITERMHQKDVETDEARQRLSAAEAAASAVEAEAAVLRANAKSAEEALQRLLGDISERDRRMAEVQQRIDESEKRLSALSEEAHETQERIAQNDNVLSGCRMKLKSREEAYRQLGEQSTKLAVESRSMDARISLLSDMEKEYEGYSKAVKTVMRESGRGTLRGVHGPVADLVRADDECALAIETALGAAAQNIVVDAQNDGRSCIELLKRNDAGRATFLPLDTIRGSVMRDAPVNDPGFVGVAFDLARFDPKYEQIFANLLGRTVIAETLGDAVRLSKNSANRLRIVTLDGQMIHAGGSMTGGSAAKGTGILSRANELVRLRAQREKLRAEEAACLTQVDKARSNLSALQYQLEMALEDQRELQAVRSSQDAEERAVKNAVEQLRLLLDSLSGDSETRRAAVLAAEKQIGDLNDRAAGKEQEAEKLHASAQLIRDEIGEISKNKLELEARRVRADRDAQQHSAQIIELERSAARIEQRKLAADMEEKQILNKLWENYELSHSAASALRQPVDNLNKTNREIADLRRSIGALGTPNLGAIEEYDRVSARYEFLAGQRDDVEKAKSELLGIIREITQEMKTVFLAQFQAIDESFRQTFLELFGGGRAALVLEDPEHVLDCGIEIEVQPPGKALSTISLLSGGEMAFVAIALYFAILKVRPTPFCVMDEIEAALDEANVSRFASYLRRMSDKTQFLVITHRRGTMEEADMLYGVTMQEKGVSSVMALDLESARKTMDE